MRKKREDQDRPWRFNSGRSKGVRYLTLSAGESRPSRILSFRKRREGWRERKERNNYMKEACKKVKRIPYASQSTKPSPERESERKERFKKRRVTHSKHQHLNYFYYNHQSPFQHLQYVQQPNQASPPPPSPSHYQSLYQSNNSYT